jgi:transposase
MSKKKISQPNVQLPSVLEQLNLNAAGLDIGAEEIYACVPSDRAEQPIRVFGTYTANLHELADWLTACGIDTVAMESTGIYWITVYDLLEARGVRVYLVNARHLKNVPGRKTDVSDCQWLQQLHSHGLLRASFRPPADICALQALARHRDNLIRYQAAHIQHMQKALQLMNLKLSEVVSDITGVTGQRIIRSILAGERDPQRLAHLRDPKCAKSEAEIAQALTGHYQAEHLFVLKQAVEQYDFYQRQLAECDAAIEALYAQFPPTAPGANCPPPAAKTTQRRKNQAHFDLAGHLYRLVGVDLTAIDGLGALTVHTIISEVGVDLSPWRTVKHFTSWLGLAPCPEKSAGKVLRTGTKKTQNRATQAFRIAAQSVSHSQSTIGAFYRRERARFGPAEAITATAHKLARVFYKLLTERIPYVDPGQGDYDRKHRARIIRTLERKAAILGLRVVPAEAPSVS